MKQLKKFLQGDQKISPFSVVIFLATIAGALFVRLYGLSEYAFGDDELWHLTVANQENLWQVIKFNFVEEIHPPLSYVIWHLMLQVSDNDLWLRMSSIVPGILLIPSAYLFGRLYIGRAAGYSLALLFAFGAMPVSISTAIRAYSLMMLALTWAAIFVHKYRFEISEKSRKKSLIFYSLCTFVAIELNHAACFTIFALGLILIFQTIKEKNKKDFLIISVIHATLVFLVAAYVFILKTYYGFGGLPGYFSSQETLKYLMKYLTIFLRFMIGDGFEDFVSVRLVLVGLIAFFVVPFALIRAKKWTLLHLILTPLALLIFCDLFRIYPFSVFERNNLFLFLGVVVTYAYFVQRCADLCCQLGANKKSLIFLQKPASLLVIILITSYLINHNSFRGVMQSCMEFTIKKSDVDFLNQELRQKNTADNVFVTVTRSIWYWRLQNSDKNKITILTKNLAKFENGEITIYFTAFPAVGASVASDMLEYQLFFEDLFAHLQKDGSLAKVKSFTFFDVGLQVEYLAGVFHPQLVIDLKETKDEMEYKRWREGYEMGWAFQRSKEVLHRAYLKDTTTSCGREVLLVSFTPQFVRDEIFGKDFFDWRKFDNEQVLRK
ncbi:MAG: hypothetical protein KA100_05715 [Rickettsiales bacterium]|nr:hypothetical protein [Rickettsiales bacterium]